jgi:hypothetical protein
MIDQEKIKDYTESAIEQNQDKIRAVFSEAEKKVRVGQEQLTKIASNLNKQAHESPWPLISGIGLGCLLLGVIIGKMRD